MDEETLKKKFWGWGWDDQKVLRHFGRNDLIDFTEDAFRGEGTSNTYTTKDWKIITAKLETHELLDKWKSLLQKRSAYIYELQKRINGEWEFGKSWIHLTEEQQGELEKRWPSAHRPEIVIGRSPLIVVPSGTRYLMEKETMGMDSFSHDADIFHHFTIRITGCSDLTGISGRKGSLVLHG